MHNEHRATCNPHAANMESWVAIPCGGGCGVVLRLTRPGIHDAACMIGRMGLALATGELGCPRCFPPLGAIPATNVPTYGIENSHLN